MVPRCLWFRVFVYSSPNVPRHLLATERESPPARDPRLRRESLSVRLWILSANSLQVGLQKWLQRVSILPIRPEPDIAVRPYEVDR